ncbi:MAG: hypothetical protein FJ246_04310 [Nitrospira sp.]|nr:hypothetical protein [Nitrospira sp.]
MKIRRKQPKLPKSGHPLYIIGYRAAPPTLAEVRTWFDLEYGGPLVLKEDAADPSALVLATHGPWTAAYSLALPPSEAASWKERLGWGHDRAGLLLRATAPASKAIDLVLHAARLARGLALLTDGTTYDAATHDYRNPSDWKDRPLAGFITEDHVTVDHAESGDPGLERFYTRGLAKFGLDELETFRPLGLPSRPVLEQLADIAGEILRIGHLPTVGAAISLPGIGLALRVIRHRTTSPVEGSIPCREITWQGA